VDDALQDGLRRLGLAINDAVTGSEDVNAALEAIRARGTEIFLVLEATICIQRGDDDEDEAPQDSDDPTPLEISAEDRHFLKRLRISVERDGDEEA
jgi:hypothetical protein